MTENQVIDAIPNLLASQRSFFKTQETKAIPFRKKQLQKLLNEVIKREADISLAAVIFDIRYRRILMVFCRASVPQVKEKAESFPIQLMTGVLMNYHHIGA